MKTVRAASLLLPFSSRVDYDRAGFVALVPLVDLAFDILAVLLVLDAVVDKQLRTVTAAT